MAKVLMYSKPYCPFCQRAKALLQKKGVAFEDLDISDKPALREEMIAKSGRHTVPQIFINDQPIGGCDDLHALDAQGQLDPLLRG